MKRRGGEMKTESKEVNSGAQDGKEEKEVLRCLNVQSTISSI